MAPQAPPVTRIGVHENDQQPFSFSSEPIAHNRLSSAGSTREFPIPDPAPRSFPTWTRTTLRQLVAISGADLRFSRKARCCSTTRSNALASPTGFHFHLSSRAQCARRKTAGNDWRLPRPTPALAISFIRLGDGRRTRVGVQGVQFLNHASEAFSASWLGSRGSWSRNACVGALIASSHWWSLAEEDGSRTHLGPSDGPTRI